MISEQQHKIYKRRARFKKLMSEGQAELAYGVVNDYYYRDTEFLLNRIAGLEKRIEEVMEEYRELAEWAKGR